MKIVILDGFTAIRNDLDWTSLEAYGEVTAYDRTRPEDVIERIGDAEIILTNKVVITEEIMAQLPNLRYIGVLATGYNVIDLPAAHKRGITVTNIPAYSSMSVAQLGMAHLLNVVNRIDHYAQQNRQGRWNTEPDVCYLDHPLMELAGKRFTVIGLGSIGSAMARMAQAFGMEVCAVTSKPQSALPDHILSIPMDEALRTSDVISLHCPLCEDTHHLLNAETISLMKPSAIVLNTSRGPLVDDHAMAAALRNGTIAAYCTDVIAVEPPVNGNPLFAEPHAYVTPHIGWASHEARARLVDIAAGNIAAFLSGEPVNVV